jgi:hypothetical protein
MSRDVPRVRRDLDRIARIALDRANARDPSSEFSPLARSRACFAPRVARTSSTARARAFRRAIRARRATCAAPRVETRRRIRRNDGVVYASYA